MQFKVFYVGNTNALHLDFFVILSLLKVFSPSWVAGFIISDRLRILCSLGAGQG